MTYDLLIIFNDGFKKIIKNASSYGSSKDNGCFYYERNGYKSFLPRENVRFIGRKFDWEGE